MPSKYFLIVLLAGLIVTLTVGQAFGFTWAGGDGHFPNQDLFITSLNGNMNVNHAGELRQEELGGTLVRGEIINTESDTRAELEVLGSKIYLDERTTVEIIKTNQNTLDLLVTRGRIFVDAVEGKQDIVLQSHKLKADFFKGQASLVNYDFRRTVSLIPFNTPVIYETKNGDLGLITENGIDYLETTPYTLESFTFDHTTSSAAEFYTFVDNLTKIIN